MRRLVVWLLVALVLVAGGWWLRDNPRRSASPEPAPAERVARETPGQVELVVPDPESVQESVTDATPSAARERVEVELQSPASSAILRVRVLEPNGEPWLEPTRIPADRSDPQSWRVSSWPAKPRILVFERDDRDGLGSAVGAELSGDPARGYDSEYEVLSGARYLVGAMGPGFDGSLREVDVPRGEERVVVDLHAQDLGELALLSVRVFHRGRELDGGMDEDPFELRLEGRVGNVLLSVPWHVLRAPFELRAPAGDYRLVAEGVAGRNPAHGDVMRRRSLGRCQRALRLVAGDRHEIELELSEGAKLELTLIGEVDEADVRVARQTTPLGAWLDDIHEVEAALAELYLISDGWRREDVLRFRPEDLRLWNLWSLGATAVSECLPPGRHTLIARLPGGREARAAIELHERRTTPVRLRF